MLEQMDGYYNNPYKFNAKELDDDTGLYYYGARYYNPRLSIWYGVDPLAVYNPVMETQFYGDGQHNGGLFYWGNLNPYIYTYQNPIAYVDPNGKQSKVTIPRKGYTPKGGGGGISDIIDFVWSNSVSGPNPIDQVPNSRFNPIPDSKNGKSYLYRAMAESNGHPEVGNLFLRQLGVRNTDVITKDANIKNVPAAYDDMLVSPGFGNGMSVTPWIAPPTCTQFGANEKKPLWRIETSLLSASNLSFYQDGKDHANIIPLETTTLSNFRWNVQHTARQWEKYQTVEKCPK